VQESDRREKRVILVGNPNVGKSVIFRLLTGNYVLVSNFPGTTVEISRGSLQLAGGSYEVIDTPGVYSLVPQSEDERVTCDILLREKPDVVVQVADAKNLRRTLLVTSQLVEFGVPTVLVLNMMDEAEERGIEIDARGVSELFGVQVVETIAIYSQGKKRLLQAIQSAKPPRNPIMFPDGAGAALVPVNGNGRGMIPSALTAEWLATGDQNLLGEVRTFLGPDHYGRILDAQDSYRKENHRVLGREVADCRSLFLDDAASKLKKKRESRYVDSAGANASRVWLVALVAGLALFAWNEIGGALHRTTPFTVLNSLLNNWLAGLVGSVPWPALRGVIQNVFLGNFSAGHYDYGLVPELVHFALLIAPVVVPLALLLSRDRNFTKELGILTRRASTGIPILVAVLLLVYEFVGYTGAQTLVGLLEKVLFAQYLIPPLQRLIPAGFLGEFLIGKYGMISMGLTYAVAIVLPVVATFFIAFSLLEDSGYLPRLSILSDRVMRSMGLNGKAVLPMVLGLGCCTMATMTTRILHSRKERLIATLLLALGVPCSAQLGVILGIAAGFSGKATLIVIGVVASQLVLVGYLSSKLIRGRVSEFIFEIPPIRVPQMKNVLLKTGYRILWYLKEAVPLFLVGTLVLFILDKAQIDGRSLLAWIQKGLEPVLVGILHLPAQAAGIFVLGFLRRDYGAAGLFAMARDGSLTALQAVVSLIVITLFVPCLASFLVIIKEQGMKKALAITGFIVPFAIAIGGIVSWVLRTLDVTFH
jgi:ferrous iron transport protein B